MTHSSTTLHTRAILVKLSLPTFGGTMENKDITRDTLAAHGASKDGGKWKSSLIPHSASTRRQIDADEEANAFDALNSHMSATRAWHYENTLPWGKKDGWFLLPIANHQAYTDYMRDAQHRYDHLLRVLVGDWSELVADSKRLLNGSAPANAKWPTDIRDHYGYSIEFAPVPSGSDFRVALTDEEIKILAASTEQRVKDTADLAQGEATKRLFEVLAAIHQTLNSKDPKRADGMKTFRDTLIQNARDMCDVLKRLNIADDPKLESFRRQTELLAATDPDTIRTRPAVRAETADRAESILHDMTKTFGKGLFAK
jgi:hypothetical protein